MHIIEVASQRTEQFDLLAAHVAITSVQVENDEVADVLAPGRRLGCRHGHHATPRSRSIRWSSASYPASPSTSALSSPSAGADP